jgi:tripartite-type tricarboxylate transporter receptor subunit TctC
MKIFKRLLAVGACALLPLAAIAQTAFPARPVTLVVPNAPGGAVDILARLLEKQLNEIWKQPVLVVYKAGAGTVIGTDYVAKSAPDGYTIGLVVTSHVINPSLRKNMPFDTLKSLKRSPIAPDVPTVAETLPGFSVESVFGAVVPSGTPREIVNKLSADMNKVIHSEETRTRMAAIGLTPVGDTPEQFDAFIKAEIPKWAKVVKASGATVD